MLIAGEETESAGEIERFGRNRISAEIPPLERTTRSSKSFPQKMLRPSNEDNFELPRSIEKLPHDRLHVRPPFCEVSRKSRE